ncbi:MAG: acyltransferase [Novosphingobium sp.]|jgi:acetyltransferase-like isoleucine patch superfamily enzyme|nr:acyltransferase [Novosphingobium sp.]
MHRSIGKLKIGQDVIIEDGAIIEAENGSIGDRSIIRSGARIEGKYVEIGKESYLDHGALIGGGSCEHGSLKAGDWLHMGMNSQINIARNVEIGDEVGIGIETKIFTHGAYLPVDFGFPAQWGNIKIGNRVWLPNAWVNPGVTIGDNVVVGARSLVNIDLPSGCFAAGIPVKIKKRINKPQALYWLSNLHDQIFNFVCSDISTDSFNLTITYIKTNTIFNIIERTISGPVTNESEKIKNQLRRNGIRFKYINIYGEYKPWPKS